MKGNGGFRCKNISQVEIEKIAQCKQDCKYTCIVQF